jgi:glycosyltransferase involved in cell wall biosynthesis
MRIAYVVTRSDSVGGATIHVLEMARWMLSQGHDAVVFVGGQVGRPAGPVIERLAEAGVPCRPLRFLQRAVHPLYDVRAWFELMGALREFQPDLVSMHTAKAGWIGRAACARLGLAAIYTPHGLPVGDRLSRRVAPFYGLAERAAAKWGHAIVCVCERERQLALARRIAPPEQLRVIPNGVRDVPEALRASPAASPPRIVSVARFEAPKDQPTLLAAMARLGDLDWELDLVGDGPTEAANQALARRLGIAGRVRFLGYQPDVAATLARAQIFALASRSEAFPRSVLEAMRAGLPVVASDAGGVSEAVENGITGALVPRCDAAALAEALRRLILDPAARQRQGAGARARYESHFRLEYMIEKTAALYEIVHERRACPT